MLNEMNLKGPSYGQVRSSVDSEYPPKLDTLPRDCLANIVKLLSLTDQVSLRKAARAFSEVTPSVALVRAFDKSNPEQVRDCLKKGADPLIRLKQRNWSEERMLLVWAIQLAYSMKQNNYVSNILRRSLRPMILGVDARLHIDLEGYGRAPLLAIAVQLFDDLELVQALLEKGADPLSVDAQHQESKTVLELALQPKADCIFFDNTSLCYSETSFQIIQDLLEKIGSQTSFSIKGESFNKTRFNQFFGTKNIDGVSYHTLPINLGL